MILPPPPIRTPSGANLLTPAWAHLPLRYRLVLPSAPPPKYPLHQICKHMKQSQASSLSSPAVWKCSNPCVNSSSSMWEHVLRCPENRCQHRPNAFTPGQCSHHQTAGSCDSHLFSSIAFMFAENIMGTAGTRPGLPFSPARILPDTCPTSLG